MWVWSSESRRRYSAIYALNKLEEESKEGELEVPQCSALYKSVRVGLFGFFHPRTYHTLHSKIEQFEACIHLKYPDLYARYYSYANEGHKGYDAKLKSMSVEQRKEFMKGELDVMYERSRKREEERRKKQAGQQAPKEGPDSKTA